MPSMDTYKRQLQEKSKQETLPYDNQVKACYATAKILGYSESYDAFKKLFDKYYQEASSS